MNFINNYCGPKLPEEIMDWKAFRKYVVDLELQSSTVV